MKHPPAIDPAAADPERPDLPWFGTWRGVYIFVLASFLLYVALLAILSRAYS